VIGKRYPGRAVSNSLQIINIGLSQDEEGGIITGGVLLAREIQDSVVQGTLGRINT
jgi:hypothetical protein